MGAAAGALLAGGGDGGAVQNPPRPQPSPQDGGANAAVGGIAGGVAGAALGFLIGGFLERDGAPFVPGRALALIALGPADTTRAIAGELAAANGLTVREVHPLVSTADGLIVFDITDGGGVGAKVAALRRDPRVRLAQPDYVHAVAAQQPDAAAALQYGRRLIRAERLGDAATGKGVTVALIDTGVDAGHPMLRGKIADMVDVTGAGFAADVHGTLLAGIVAAEPGDASSITGAAPAARIAAIKACVPVAPGELAARCQSSAVARAVDAADQRDIRVLNLSLAGPRDPLVLRLVAAAVTRGRLVVAAAGNDGPRSKPRYPAALERVIAVTAVDVGERLYRRASRGGHLDLAAPGVEILSTGPGGGTLVSSGTSLAAAHVSAVAALLLERQPTLSPDDLQRLLEATAKDLGARGKDRAFGSGLLDACAALSRLGAPVPPCS